MTREELTVLLKFVEDELDVWERQDAIEDKEFGEFRGIDQLPKGSKQIVQKAAELYLKKARENGIKFKEELKGQLQRAEREVQKEGLRKVSLTDPESRFMKTKGGKIELSYNPQVTVDRKGFILAGEVHQNASDAEQLQPQVEQTKENLGNLPDQVVWSFDAGYFGSDNITFLADRNVDGYIPDRNEKKATNPFDKANFIYSALRDEYICPENQEVTFLGESLDIQKKKAIRVYKGQGCSTCHQQSVCTKRRDGIRYLKMFPNERELNAMRAKMKSPLGKEIYKLRQQLVEPVFGDIKENKGVRRFATRGVKTVRAEFNIICAAVNVKRIWINLQKKKGKGGNDPSLRPRKKNSVEYQFC